MKTSQSLLAIGLALAITSLTTACGGGDSGNAALNNNNSNPSGAVQGDIASIVGSYSVRVVAADCDPADSDEVTTIERVGGACKITSTTAAGTVVETQRDILPPGSYTLKITADGAMEMLQGASSKVKINCPSGGLCSVNGSVYSLVGATASGTGAASAVISQLIFNLSATPKVITAGYLYGIGSNATFAGTSPLLSNETGVLALDQ